MNCAFCRRPLVGNVVIFCHDHYWQIPAPERASLRGMWLKKQDVTSKVAKCVRILTKKKQTNPSNEQRPTTHGVSPAAAHLQATPRA